MHIAYLSPEYPTAAQPHGGLANYLRKVGSLLCRRGHRVTIVFSQEHAASWEEDGMRIHAVSKALPASLKMVRRFGGLAVFADQYLTTGKMARRLWQVHARQPVDIVQVSSYMAPGCTLVGNGRLPVVCRISSHTPLLRAASGKEKGRWDGWSDRLEMRQILQSDGTFAPSRFLADFFQRTEGIQPEVIPSPLFLEKVDTDPEVYAERLQGRRYLLFFGRLSRVKGCDLIGDILPELLQRHGDLEMVFVGMDTGLPNGQKMSRYLLEQGAGFHERIHFFDPLPKEKLYPVIAGSLGVILPSRVDNYPNACLEALSLGVPVIGSRDSSLDEIIVDGTTGFLFANGDRQDLSRAVETLLAMDETGRQRVGHNIKTYLQKIEQEDRVGQLLNYYEAVRAGFLTRTA
ncbi:glycosyltransferase family 4 protein [Thiovibrio sp. JS02]